MRPIVTLLTDFGLADSYVAEMKAAILSEALPCSPISAWPTATSRR